MKTIFLSPSDLAFLLDDSPWGFYQKYNLGIKRPPVIIPRIFTVIDVLTKVCCENKTMKEFDESFPDAVLTGADQWVKSKPIINPDFPDIEIILRGKIDGVLKFADGTHSVIDFKTCEIQEKTLQKYVRQLSCYSYAMANPNSTSDYSVKINDKIGLFVYEPNKFSISEDGSANLGGKLKYIEYNLDLDEFAGFIKKQVIPLIAGKEPPPNDEDPCWVYLKQFGFEYEED
jgi:hypothetical protein